MHTGAARTSTRGFDGRPGRCNAATGRHLPVSLPTPTLDSIQCHSISQCNAHAAAYRCTAFRNETAAVSTGTSLLSVPLVTGPAAIALSPSSIKISREYGTRAPLSLAQRRAAFTQILFFSYTSLFIHGRPRCRRPFPSNLSRRRVANGLAHPRTHYTTVPRKL